MASAAETQTMLMPKTNKISLFIRLSSCQLWTVARAS
jgi:hypothetical protein